MKNKIELRIAFLKEQMAKLRQAGFNTEKSKQQEEIDYLTRVLENMNKS